MNWRVEFDGLLDAMTPGIAYSTQQMCLQIGMSHTTTCMLLRRAQLEGRVRKTGGSYWMRVVDAPDGGQTLAGT
jgi:hypothetical protein